MWKWLSLESCYMYVAVKMENVYKYYGWFRIKFDEVIESYNKETKTIPTNFNEKKGICKMHRFYLHFQ